jgi:hypothetical protein
MASYHYINTYTDPKDRFLESNLDDDTGFKEYVEQLTRERRPDFLEVEPVSDSTIRRPLAKVNS